MARSLSLAAYLALVRRNTAEPPPPQLKRPKGELIWGHVDDPARIAALMQLVTRLAPMRRGLHLLITVPPGTIRPEKLKPNVLWQEVPQETQGEVDQFLNHWSPDICLWSGGHLRPALIVGASLQKTPLYLIDAGEVGFDEPRWRWLPNMAREVLSLFSGYYTTTANAAVRLRKLGVPASELTISGPLQDGGTPLPCNEAEREHLARLLTGRPIWLAAMAQMDELEMLLRAHRLASRLAHRLLLVLVPDQESDSNAIQATLAEDGWRTVVWSHGNEPDENTQVLLADTRGEMGLWYRLAPITFMASSLVNGHGGHDPFEPAALGSAILYGPHVGRHLEAYSRFANAGAARMIKDADTLANGVSRLIAPDQAASMALAAWEVSSNGAEVTDLLVDLVQDVLDKAGG